MAKVGRRGRRKQSVSGFFRQQFEEHPEWLHSSSNEELINSWKAAFPNTTEKQLRKVKANLANVKSLLRRKEREGGRGRGRPGRPPGRPSMASAGNAFTGRPTMERLEEHIDEGLIMAKNLDRAGLEKVIKLLRSARNEVVWKMGQKQAE